jgi:hypothetical protein
MKPTPEQAEAALTEWRQQTRTERRDQLVRWAHHEAGLSINRIHVLSGIARPTIYRILENAT